MRDLGVYEKSYDETVFKLADLLVDYADAREQFEAGGRQFFIEYTNTAGATNYNKNPLYQSIERMRMDILAMCRELGITPAGLKKIKGDKAESGQGGNLLAEVLTELSS